jgi:hypothetical protein
MINLGFLTEGKTLLLYSSHLPLGVPNGPVIYFINSVASMGRTKPRTVAELMDIANRFADGEHAYNNKRARSPEDDKHLRHHNQSRRPRNYDNHNQVTAGFKVKSSEEGEHKNTVYCSKHKPGNSKQFWPEGYDLSPEKILNGPCQMHYGYVDGKKVSNHLMRDCMTYLRLEEATGFKQANKPLQIAHGAFDGCEVSHVSRASNEEADTLANIGSQCLPIPLGVFWEEITVRSIHGVKLSNPKKQQTHENKYSGADVVPEGDNMEPEDAVEARRIA